MGKLLGIILSFIGATLLYSYYIPSSVLKWNVPNPSGYIGTIIALILVIVGLYNIFKRPKYMPRY